MIAIFFTPDLVATLTLIFRAPKQNGDQSLPTYKASNFKFTTIACPPRRLRIRPILCK